MFSTSLRLSRTCRTTRMLLDIPSIDFKPFLDGSASERQRVASAIDAALRSVGFFYLHNHGIEKSKIDNCFQLSRQFFALSDAKKAAIPLLHNRGYSRVGNEKVHDRICMKENFDCGNPNDPGWGNNWPTEDLTPGFRDITEDVFQDCDKLIHQLLCCLSLALNLRDGDSLGKHHASSSFKLSLIHYPAISANLHQSGLLFRNPAHADFGTITLLFQDDVGGFEIADMSSTTEVKSAALEKLGNFIHVDPEPGAILVNVGYLLMRWTNSRWRNTVHRVSEPPNRAKQNEGMIPERFSIAFFGTPDPATVIEPLSCCCNDEAPKRWGPLNAGEYLHKKGAAMHI